MIYLLVAYLMIGSFMAGCFYEYNDQSFELEDKLALLVAIVFGVPILIIAKASSIYNSLKRK